MIGLIELLQYVGGAIFLAAVLTWMNTTSGSFDPDDED